MSDEKPKEHPSSVFEHNGIHVLDRADMVKGHYCIARKLNGDPKSIYWEFWNTNTPMVWTWASAGTVFYDLNQARAWAIFLATQQQKDINFNWLLGQMEAVHQKVAPAHFGTWQERAIQCVSTSGKLAAYAVALEHMNELLVEALNPIVQFIDQFDRKPLVKIDDQFYGIHTGTEFEASLRFSDFRKLSQLVKRYSHESTKSLHPGSDSTRKG